MKEGRERVMSLKCHLTFEVDEEHIPWRTSVAQIWSLLHMAKGNRTPEADSFCFCLLNNPHNKKMYFFLSLPHFRPVLQLELSLVWAPVWT